MRSTLAAGLTTIALFLPAHLQADEPRAPAALLEKLARSAARFEAMMRRVSFTVSGRMGDAVGDGAFEVNKEGAARVTVRGDDAKVEILKYVEEGQDKTEEANRKAAERARERKPRSDDDEVHLPFLEGEQAKYDFWIGEIDPKDPARACIFFHTKVPAQNRMNGSAWVDTRTGDLLNASVTASRTSAFIDYLRVKMEFGEQTTMGPAISKLSFDTKGGFLFLRKHYRGSATFASYVLDPM